MSLKDKLSSKIQTAVKKGKDFADNSKKAAAEEYRNLEKKDPRLAEKTGKFKESFKEGVNTAKEKASDLLEDASKAASKAKEKTSGLVDDAGKAAKKAKEKASELVDDAGKAAQKAKSHSNKLLETASDKVSQETEEATDHLHDKLADSHDELKPQEAADHKE